MSSVPEALIDPNCSPELRPQFYIFVHCSGMQERSVCLMK